MTQDERPRLFVATEVPREQLEVVDRALAPLRAQLAGARWTPVENQHVTCKFLGSTPASLLADVLEACRSVARAVGPASVRLDGIGGFPSTRRVRVLWVGLDDPAHVLTRIADELDSAFEPLGFAREQRAFTPHLTLARFKVPARFDELPRLRELFDPFEVRTLTLFRSRLSPKGARYEVVEECALHGEQAATQAADAAPDTGGRTR